MRDSAFLQSRGLDGAPGSGFSRVLRVRHRFQPSDVLAPLRFLHGNVFERVLCGRPVPVFFTRRNPDGVAGTDFAYRTAPGLHTTDARRDKKCLSERVGVPGRARARFEADPGGSDSRRIGRLDDGILPDRSSKTRRSHSARGPRSASDNVHADFSPVRRSVLRLTIRMQYFKSDTSSVPNAKSPALPPGFDFNVKCR
jgi:hypothetical protein